ncbi:MAG: Ig-like domain-containing protein [Lachnospiraceae bacterium]|nr:Ig-like domain-containing protein [Lachnospiraceae bacterium]
MKSNFMRSVMGIVMTLVLSIGSIPVRAEEEYVSETAESTEFTESGRNGVEKPDLKGLAELYAGIGSYSSLYAVAPRTASDSYSPAVLSDEAKAYFLRRLNYYRRVAGLGDVILADAANDQAAWGALCLAMQNSGLSHEPSKPAGMSDDDYAKAKAACKSSNLSYAGGYSATSILGTAIDGQMEDDSGSNLDCLGHRRWLINPGLLAAGVGSANNGSTYYTDVEVFGDTVTRTSYDDYSFISWPASGYNLSDTFAASTPWSVTLNPSYYSAPAFADVSVSVTKEGDESVNWVFNSETGTDDSATKPYFNVNNSGYGVSNCIIFRPASQNLSAYKGVYYVTVSGIKDISGADTSLSYYVDFTDYASIVSDGPDGPDDPDDPVVTAGKLTLKADIFNDAALKAVDLINEFAEAEGIEGAFNMTENLQALAVQEGFEMLISEILHNAKGEFAAGNGFYTWTSSYYDNYAYEHFYDSDELAKDILETFKKYYITVEEDGCHVLKASRQLGIGVINGRGSGLVFYIILADDTDGSTVAAKENELAASREIEFSSDCIEFLLYGPGKEISIGDTEQVELYARNKNDKDKKAPVTFADLTFTSSAPSVVTVDRLGNIKAVAAGEATITAASAANAVSAGCKITVNADKKPDEEKDDVYVPVMGIKLDKESAELQTGETLKLNVSFTPENASDKTLFWKSSDTSVATVKDGEVSALKEGKTVISAMAFDGGFIAKCQISVYKDKPQDEEKADTSKYTAEEDVLAVKSINLKKTVFAGISGISRYEVVSGDPTAVKIKGNTLTVLKSGTVEIEALDKTSQALDRKKLKLVRPEILSTISRTIDRGGSVDLNKYIDSTVKPSAWKSSSRKIAEVSEDGMLKLNKNGKVTITVSFPSETGMKARKLSIKLKIAMPQFKKSSYKVKAGRTVQTAVKNLNGAYPTYRIEDPSVASVDANGAVTGVSAGTTMLYVKVNGLEYGTKIKVR